MKNNSRNYIQGLEVLNKEIISLPSKSGIYKMLDSRGNVLYIGKAKNLKKRVLSYFNKSNKNSKNKIMISKAVDVDSMIAKNEVEALLIEANMIKLYKPKYNVFMKDDKSFPYIIITNEAYPRVEIIRKKNLHKDNNIYFGPYTDVHYLRSIIKIIHQIFPVRTCNNYIDKKLNNKKITRKGTCFCGFCLSEEVVTEKQYSEIIKKVIQFLKGKNKNVKIFLNKLMNQASFKMRYEEAARIRDQINALNVFEKKQTKITQKFVNRDIINIEYKNIYGLALILRVRNGVLVGREKFNLKIFNDLNISDELGRFLVQYYQLTMDLPSEILIKNNIESKLYIEEWLSDKKSSKVKILIPNRGDKKQMLDLCIKNNQMLLKEYLIKKIKRKEFMPKTLVDLKNDLNMSVIPKRIEAFDNSNTQGDSAVAGMVCFIDGKPVKSKYRRYNIKTVKGIDDFESMREVVYRRYLRQLNENKSLPDLILIDGGKGQLSAAKSSLDKLNLGYISIVGLAKKLEEIYLPGLSSPQNIGKTSASLYLLRKIRDEVHRFSIKFHRLKKHKSIFNSILNDINGLGDKRIRLIWKNYNSLYDLNNDSISNIYNKTKIPISIIKKIRNKINIRNENE